MTVNAKFWLLVMVSIMAIKKIQDSSKLPITASNPMDAKHAPVRNLIIQSAKKAGVSPRVALAFSWLESRFNKAAEGDKDWATWDNGARYQKNVLGNPKFASSPFRNTPTLWRSYGLFQLLAPYFVSGNEDPRILLDPAINAERAMKKIAASLKTANGNVQQARIIYAGAANLSDTVKQQLASKITEALKLFPASLG